MAIRRSPYEHDVGSHLRSGRPVSKYRRGRGIKPQRPSRVVGGSPKPVDSQPIEDVVVNHLQQLATNMRGNWSEEELEDTDLGWQIDMVDHTIHEVQQMKLKESPQLDGSKPTEEVVVNYLQWLATKMRGNWTDEELEDTDLGWQIGMVDHTIDEVRRKH